MTTETYKKEFPDEIKVFDGRSPKKPKAKEVEPFAEKELGLLMPRLEGEWIGPLIKFALSSGCRIGEMIGLTWSDIEFDTDDSRPGFVQISRSVRTNDVNGIVVSPPKTARGRRKIELSSITMKLLAEKAVVNNSRGLVTDEWTENELVFPSRAGTYSYQSNVLKEFKRICKAAGIDWTVNLHMCRHSHATIAIKSGVDLHTLSRRMGHSSISITADLYGHLIEGMQSVAAQAFDEIIR